MKTITAIVLLSSFFLLPLGHSPGGPEERFIIYSPSGWPRVGVVEDTFSAFPGWYIVRAHEAEVHGPEAIARGVIFAIRDYPVHAFDEWKRQWGIKNTGDYIPQKPVCVDTPRTSLAGADANVLGAWEITEGEGITVAVTDTGVDDRHSQLAGRVIDAVSFVPVGDVRDHYGHGTHVAGIIAAVRDGREPIGVLPRANIISVKILDDQGSGFLSWIFKGFEYIIMQAREGVDVDAVNASWGGYVPRQEILPVIREVFGELKRLGIPLVVAAGNSGVPVSDGDFPCGFGDLFDNIICVAAFSPNGKRSCFSNCNDPKNPHVHLAAPGEDILSTLPDEKLDFWSGTSMATPMVAAAVAAVHHLVGHRFDRTRKIITDTAIPFYAFPRRPIGDDQPKGDLVMPVIEFTQPCESLSSWAIYGVVDVASALHYAAVVR